MEITTTFCPTNRSEWRKWLQENHDKKSEIWLLYFKKHTKKPTVTYEESVEEALCFGWIDGIRKRINDEQSALRFTPRKSLSHWSESNIKRYRELVKNGRMTTRGKAAYEEYKKREKQ